MAISAAELNPHSYPVTEEQAKNLEILRIRINKIRDAYAMPLIVTSGLRSEADQKRINPGAPKSKHLIGAAVDISDPSGSLKAWILRNLSLVEEVGLWFEDFSATPTWVHAQIVPPKSGRRFFSP